MVSINPFDDADGSFFALVTDEDQQPVADLRRCYGRPAGGVRFEAGDTVITDDPRGPQVTTDGGKTGYVARRVGGPADTTRFTVTVADPFVALLAAIVMVWL